MFIPKTIILSRENKRHFGYTIAYMNILKNKQKKKTCTKIVYMLLNEQNLPKDTSPQFTKFNYDLPNAAHINRIEREVLWLFNPLLKNLSMYVRK